MDGGSRRNNLISTGLQKQTEADYELWEDCEKLVKDLIHDQLKITEDIYFDKVRRLHDDSKSPIIARFANLKDQQRALNQKRKPSETTQGSAIFIGEDFSEGIRDVSRRLVPFFKR